LQVLGVHGHQEETHAGHGHQESDGHNHTEIGEEHGHVDEARVQLLKMSVILAAVYLLYVVEFVASSGRKQSHRKVHHHHEEAITGSSSSSRSAARRPSLVASDDEPMLCGMRSVAMVVLIGDAVHNLVDGIAVGASFTVSTRLGISTSIAVICHELPHEIGDLAVLLESGLSIPRALILNLVSALTAFAGLFLGLAAGSNEELVVWLLAVTAGMFLYVAWLNMLSHLKHNANIGQSWQMTLVLQTIGFAIGFGVIFLIGWFEDSIGDL